MEKFSISTESHLSLLNSNLSSTFLSPVNSQWLIEQSNLPFLLQILPAHTLYSVLNEAELQESLELVEWIRGTQLQKILDFDIWEFDSAYEADDISHDAIMSWIHAWLLIDKEFAAERFLELDEEVALLILTKLFTILPEGIAHLTDEARENLTATPDKRFFLSAHSSNSDDFELLTQFIDALYSYDMARAGFVFASAAMLVRQETLCFAHKWREARLSDQGFVPLEQAYQIIFSQKNEPQVLSQKQNLANASNFIEEDAREQMHELMSKIGTEDGFYLIKQALTTQDIKQITGSQNTSIDHLNDDDEFIDDSITHIVKQTQKIIHLLGLRKFDDTKETLFIEKLLQYYYQKNQHNGLYIQQKIAYLTNTVGSLLSGKNAYQSLAVQTAMYIVRGAINIGLEMLLNNKSFDLQSDSQTTDNLNEGVKVLENFGIDYIFKMGFNQIIDLQKLLLSTLSELKLTSMHTRTSARNWIHSPDFGHSTEIFLTLDGLLRIIPMVNDDILLSKDINKASLPSHLTQKYKPFETHEEVLYFSEFIKNLKHNLN